MNNPWNRVALAAYEAHMSAEGVMQLQLLSDITRQQLQYGKASVVILGAAGGNGLEHVDPTLTKKVWAVDINDDYLDACGQRHVRLGSALETLKLDLSAPGEALPPAELLICNLIVEYLGVRAFAELIDANKERIGVVSCVIQKNNGASFVSASASAKELECLDALHRDIDEAQLTAAMVAIGCCCIFRRSYGLPGAKEFIRIDFVKEHDTNHDNGEK